jgi:kinesin family protein 2/24
VNRFRSKPFAAPPGTAVAHPASNLKVCIRKRPFFPHEHQAGEFDVISCLPERVVVHDARMQPDMRNMFVNHHDFSFDEVFEETIDNEEVYDRSASEIVQAAALGGHGTVMMYGQTGSGKTYTMSSFYKQAADELFEHATSKVVSVYFIELLGDKCFDMLHGGTPCNLVSASDGSVHPHPCVEIDVTSASELLAVINMAGKLRATAATGVHDQSSRSHALCRIFIREDGSDEEGSLTLVDLAGTEHRIDNAEHNSDRQREGAKINASLAALKECIRASASGSKFVAFRQNRLTQLLRGCFATSRPHPTVVIATVSPSSKDTEHSLNTLRHACIMDGQGQGKAAQSAHVTGGIVTKESLGEIDVTRLAREKAAARRSSTQQDGHTGKPRQSPPAHQTKQSNTVKRASLDRRCLQALPPGMADRLMASRNGLCHERQRARLRPKEEIVLTEEYRDATPVKCIVGEEGISLLDRATDNSSLADANCILPVKSESQPSMESRPPMPMPVHGRISNSSTSLEELFSEGNWEGQAARFEALDNALQDCPEILRDFADDAAGPAGSPSSADFCRAAWEEEPLQRSRSRSKEDVLPSGRELARSSVLKECMLPPTKELPRSPVGSSQFRESLDSAAGSPDSATFSMENGDEAEALSDDKDSSVQDCMEPPSSKGDILGSADYRDILVENLVAHECDSAMPDAMPERRSSLSRSLFSEDEDIANPEKVIHIRPTNGVSEEDLDTSGLCSESCGADASQGDDERAHSLFRIFCSEGRDARIWRKNDLRLINNCVLPSLFGPSAKITWAHTHVALDELERLVSGPRSVGPVQERPRRRHRQPSQQTTIQEQFRSSHQTAWSSASLPTPPPSKLRSSASCTINGQQSQHSRRSSHRANTEPQPVAHRSMVTSGSCLASQPDLRSMTDRPSSGEFHTAKLERKAIQAASAAADVTKWLEELRQDLHRGDR